MLEVINLGCARGQRKLFSGLNFSVPAGGLLEAIGPNGSGKTSLLRIICGLMSPIEGEVRFKGKTIRHLGEEYFDTMAYVAHQNGVKDELSPFENLRISTGVAGKNLSPREAVTILERVGLRKQQNLPARLLSAGQRRRLGLSRLLAGKATLWILDEPLSSLDVEGMTLVGELIGAHLNGGGMAIIATHQELNLTVGSTQRIDLAT